MARLPQGSPASGGQYRHSGFPSLSVRVIVSAGRLPSIRRDVADQLAEKFQVEPSTLQVEHLGAPELLTLHSTPRLRL